MSSPKTTPTPLADAQTILSSIKKSGRITSRFSSFALLSKKRKFSESSIDSVLVPALEFVGNATRSTNISRPFQVLDNRAKSMSQLREMFAFDGDMSGIAWTHNMCIPDKLWMRIRACVEIFPLSAYCVLEFLTLVAKFTESSHFKRKLKRFRNEVEHWCSWDLFESLRKALDSFNTIVNIMKHSTVPVKFTARGCFWKDIISKALTHDLREFNDVFLDTDVVDAVHGAEEEVLQNIVDLVQTAIQHIESHDTRELDRFLKSTVEKRGILPSTIFLSRVRRIGSNFVHGGGFADVWKGEYEGRAVALKVLRIFCFTDREKMQREFSKEALLWRKLDHPNVLPFLGICRDVFAPQMALVSHWMEKGSLVEFLSQNPSADCLKLAIGVARGLDYLHTLRPQIIHGDLRAANVLLDDNEEPRITDFGLARAIDSQGTQITTSFKGKGTLRWQAPELLYASRFGEEASELTSKSDVYAFSCVCLEIFSGKVPFADLRDGGVIVEVAVNDRKPPWPGQSAALRGLNGEIWFVMQLCWKTQAADRPDMPFVVTHLESVEWRKRFPGEEHQLLTQ